MLELLKQIFLENKTLPNRNYEAKKIICPMSLDYKKINECRNDYVLYRDNFFLSWRYVRLVGYHNIKRKLMDNVDEKKEGPSTKELCYLSIIHKLKWLFVIKEDEKKKLNIKCKERKCDNFLDTQLIGRKLVKHF